MKTTASIVLIILLLFNVLGYQALFYGLHYQNELQLANDVDNERYEANEVITLKIPMNLPYSYNQVDFHRSEGKFEFNGNFYRLIQHRLDQDTLYLACLHDTESGRIEKAYSDYVRSAADHTTSDHQSNNLPSFGKEYLSTICRLKNLTDGWSSSISFNVEETQLTPSYFFSIIQPPESV